MFQLLFIQTLDLLFSQLPHQFISLYFLGTPCYKLYKEQPEENWYKPACVKVAKIYHCIDTTMRLLIKIGIKTLMKKIPGLCENVEFQN